MMEGFIKRHELFKRLERDLTAALNLNSRLASETMDKLDQAETQRQRVLHDLDIERAKRIAAEQMAVDREKELEWLREAYAQVIQSRDQAVSQQFESLNLVNVTLLKQAEAEAAPTKEVLQSFKPVPKRGGQQGVSLMRRVENDFLHKLRMKDKRVDSTQSTPAADKVG